MASILGKLLGSKKLAKAAVKDPAAIEALSAAAAAALQEKEFQRAIQLYDEIINHGGGAEIVYKRANVYNVLGQWDMAVSDYDRAVALDPEHWRAFCNRGTALERLARWQEALASYDRAIELAPNDHMSYYNRGSALTGLERFDEALISYERAISLKGDFVAALINCGNLLQKLKRHEAALASYDNAIEFEQGNASALLGRGVSLVSLRRFAEALTSYDQAIILNARFTEAYINRGIALQEMGKTEAAIASFDRAIQLDPTFAEAYQARGLSLISSRQLEAAVSSFDRAIAIDPDRRYLRGMRLHTQMQMCEWKDFTRELAVIVEGIRGRNAICPPHPLLALVDDAPLQRLTAELWVAHECPPNDVLGAIPARSMPQKIRIGYFSADFRDHAVSLLTAELFEIHDRTKFETIAFAFGPESKDPVRARLERAFDQFFDVRMHSDIEVARLARQLEIDIAVDLGGFTEHCRTGIFAFRAAPIQVSYIGYLGTMAAPYMDYLLSDAATIPEVERFNYSEKIVYLPSYQVNDSRRSGARVLAREDLGLPRRGFAFSCFNSNYKITPATFITWMRILTRVADSSLYIYSESEVVDRNLRNEAQKCGVDSDRIVFGRRMARDDYLARFRAMDLFLDTLPYNAGATASDALWAGLPVLTCAGQSFASRVAASLLRAIQLPELIASSAEHYEHLAVQLAEEPKRLFQIKAKLERNRASARLFDAKLFAANLEAAYCKMMERSEAGLPPDHIYVNL
jgi:predicted O-linked N-acetylglucosamine transferase (SPINDLY family)